MAMVEDGWQGRRRDGETEGGVGYVRSCKLRSTVEVDVYSMSMCQPLLSYCIIETTAARQSWMSDFVLYPLNSNSPFSTFCPCVDSPWAPTEMMTRCDKSENPWKMHG